MIERNLWQFGLGFILIGTPLTYWAVSSSEKLGYAPVALIPFIGSVLIMLGLQKQDNLSPFSERLLSLVVGGLFLIAGGGMINFFPELVVRGTPISYGWFVMAFGCFGAYHRFRFTEI